MTDCYSGPYRATALWNEAVLLFRNNMVLKEHRHRFHKHKNSFSGSEAVKLLLNMLCSNSMFNSNITREQCCRLLKQFLIANLISPVKSCSLRYSRTTFYDSNKYLYEFTDQLVNFEPLQPISVSNVNEQKCEQYKTSIENEQYYSIKNDGSVWKITITKRIDELIKPLNIHKVINFNFINPSWVEINADPECQSLKWNTELPDWILSAINDLIKYTTKDYCGTTYPNFEMDAFQVITDYFKTLGVPLIDQRSYELYKTVFHHLEYLNCMEVVKSPKKNFQDDTGLEGACNKHKSSICIPDKFLPPNYCYEAAFTSDDPTIRVVPQCSVDSIHLRKKNCEHNDDIKTVSCEKGIENCNDPHIFLRDSSHEHFFQEENYKTNQFKRNYKPLKTIDNLINKRSLGAKFGIVNDGFMVYSPNIKKIYEENIFCISNESDCLKKNEVVHEVKRPEMDNQLNEFIYINHGLSFSVEDINLLAHNNLDYNYALESLNNLMKVSQYNQSVSDDDHSFHTALSRSEFDLSDIESSSGNLQTNDTYATEWDPGIIELGSHVFQLLLILLPPPNRAKLKVLSSLLYNVSRHVLIPEFSLSNMLLKLEMCILKPMDIETNEFSTVHNILSFIVNNHKMIFAELPSDFLSNIKSGLYEQQSKKNISFNQASKNPVNIQKNEDSKNSLTKLLDHILQNKDISEKERKKHLKLFRDCYPGIYRSRFPHESKHTKGLFSIKNLRL